jgi:hypothetical protein
MPRRRVASLPVSKAGCAASQAGRSSRQAHLPSPHPGLAPASTTAIGRGWSLEMLTPVIFVRIVRSSSSSASRAAISNGSANASHLLLCLRWHVVRCHFDLEPHLRLFRPVDVASCSSLIEIGDTIARRAGGINQPRELGQRIHRHKTPIDTQCHAIGDLDCTSSRRSTVTRALPRATVVTTEYQRDSSSKRPRSSVASAARTPTRGSPNGCQPECSPRSADREGLTEGHSISAK